MAKQHSVKAGLRKMVGGAILVGVSVALATFGGGLSDWTGLGGPSDDIVQRFVAKQVPHGARTTYQLAQAPMDTYRSDAYEDDRYGADVLLSPSLSYAANDVAFFYQQTRRLAPSEVLSSFLNAGGAPYWGVHQTVLVTTLEGDQPIRELLAEAVANFDGQPHIGLGETRVMDDPRLRIITLLLAKKTFDFHRLKKSLSAGQKTRITGKLEAGYTAPQILAMNPAGHIRSIPVRTHANQFQFNLQTSPGRWTIEVIATGPVGPIPLAQVELYVSEPPPNRIEYRWPQNEDSIKSPSTYLTTLVNLSRKEAGLKELKRVRILDWVAWQHSEDMRIHEYVGHFSPRSGMLTQRLDRVAYARNSAGENVALNSTIADAHQGLMHSLGHRRNLLNGDYTELGIGVRKGRIGWYITQIFSGGGASERLERNKHANLTLGTK